MKKMSLVVFVVVFSILLQTFAGAGIYLVAKPGGTLGYAESGISYATDLSPADQDNADISNTYNSFTGPAIWVDQKDQEPGTQIISQLGVSKNKVNVVVKSISESLKPYIDLDGRSLMRNSTLNNIQGLVTVKFNKGLGTEKTKTFNVTYVSSNPTARDTALVDESAYNFTSAAISVDYKNQVVSSQAIEYLGIDQNGVTVSIKYIGNTLKPYIGLDGTSLKQNGFNYDLCDSIILAFNKGSATELTKSISVTYRKNPAFNDIDDIAYSCNNYNYPLISVNYSNQKTGYQVINGLGVNTLGVNVAIKSISDNLKPYLGNDGKVIKTNNTIYDIAGQVVVSFNKGEGSEATKLLNVSYLTNPSSNYNADITASLNAFTASAISLGHSNQSAGSQVIKGLGIDSNGVTISVKDISNNLKPYLGPDGKSLKQNDTNADITGSVVLAFDKDTGIEQTQTMDVTYLAKPIKTDNADITASLNAYTTSALLVSPADQVTGTQVVDELGIDSNGVTVTIKSISDSLKSYLGTDGKSLKANDTSANIEGSVVIAFNKGVGTEQTKTINVTYSIDPSVKDSADITASFNAFTSSAISVSLADQVAGAQVIRCLSVDSNGVTISIKSISDSLKSYLGTDGKSLKKNDTPASIEGSVVVAFNKGAGTEQTKTINVTYISDPSTKDNADITASFNAFTGSAISVSTTEQAIGAQIVNGLGVDSNSVTVTIKSISDSLKSYIGTDGKSLKKNDTSANIEGSVVIAFNKGAGTEQTKTINVTYVSDPSTKDDADIAASFNTFTGSAISVSTTEQAVGVQIVNGLGVDSNGVTVTIKSISDSLKSFLGADGKSLKKNDTSDNIEGSVVIAFNKGAGTEQIKTMNITYVSDPSTKDNADITASFNAFTGSAISVSTTEQAVGVQIVNGLGVDSNGVTVTIKSISDSLKSYLGTDGKSLKKNDTSANIEGSVVIAFNKGAGTEQIKTINITYVCDPSTKDNADITASFNAFTGSAISVSTTEQAVGVQIVNGLGVDSNGVTVTIKSISDSLKSFLGADGKSLKKNDTSANIEGSVVIAFNKGAGTEQIKTMNITYVSDPSTKDNADIAASFNAFTGSAISVSTTEQAVGVQIVNGLGVDSSGVTVTIKSISDSLKSFLGANGKSLKKNDTSANIEGSVVIAFNKGAGTEQIKTMNITYVCDPSTKDNADIAASFNAFTGSAISVSTTDQAIGVQIVNGLGVDSNGVSVTIKTISDSLKSFLGADGKSLKKNDTSANIEGSVVIAFNKGAGTEQTKTINVTYVCDPSTKDNADITASFNAFTGSTISVSTTEQAIGVQIVNSLGVDSNGVTVTIKTISDSLKSFLGADGKSLEKNDTSANIEGSVVIAFNKGSGTEQTKTINVTYVCDPSTKDNADITASFNAFTGSAISVSTTDQAIGVQIVNGLGVDSNGVSVTIKTISDSLKSFLGADGKSLKKNDTSANIEGSVVIAFNKGAGTEQTKTINVTYVCDPSTKDNADITASFNAFTGSAISVSTTEQAIGVQIVNGLGVDSSGVTVTIKSISDSLKSFLGADGKSLKKNDTSANIEGSVVIAFNKGAGTEQTKTINITYVSDPSTKDNADITASFNAFTGSAISVAFSEQAAGTRIVNSLGIDSNGVTVSIKSISDNLKSFLGTDGKSLKQNDTASKIEGSIVIAFSKGSGTEKTKTINIVYNTKPLVTTFGDTNNDGVINLVDYLILKQYTMNKITAFQSNAPLFVGDLDGDGKINVVDCLILKKYLIDNSTIFPIEDPKKAGVLFVGRFDNSDPTGPKFAWSNTFIKASFLGSDVSVKLKSTGNNWFNVMIDGNVLSTPLNVEGTKTVSLASGLPYAVHTVEIFKRTEASLGEAQFLGFDFGSGKLLKTPLPSSRLIEFIGDSIDCGYGNEGQAGAYFHPINENGYLAYGAVACRALNADQINISYSGKGVVQNCDKTATNLMPELYLRTLPVNPDSKWGFNSTAPQIVVINLGTNDFNGSIPDKQKFVTAYSNLVSTVRSHYPSAHIYCAFGPILNTGCLLKDYITTVVNDKNTSGDMNVHFIEFPQQTATNGYGEDNHPSVKTHEITGKLLAEKIRDDLGW